MYHHDSSNRKYLIFSLVAAVVFMSAFAFYGCQFFLPQNEPVNVDEQPQSRRIGVIKSLGGIRTSNQGTHLLQLDNGDTILLKSLQINLDDSKYGGKSVEVSGILTYTTDRKQIMEVMSIDVIGDRDSQQVAAPAWKSYGNEGSGITIKYRDDLTLDESYADKIIFKREFSGEPLGTQVLSQESTPALELLTHKMIIETDPAGDSTDLTDYVRKINPGLKGETAADLLTLGLSRSKIGSDSLDAYKKVDTDSGVSVVTYYASAGSVILKVTLESGNDNRTLEDQNLFYEMLGTLKLAGADGAATAPTEEEGDYPATVESDTANNVKMESAAEVEDLSKPVVEFTADDNFETDLVPGAENIGTAPDVATEESLDGYSLMESDSFKFSLQYPKSWFYSGTASDEAGVIRHYDFGTKPLDEAEGSVSMDIMTGSVPDGTAEEINGKTVVTVKDGDTVTVYVKGSGSRIYKFSGSTSDRQTLINVAATVKD